MDYVSRHYSEYSQDKGHLRFILNQSPATLDNQTLRELTQLCEKWQDYPLFRRGLDHYYALLKQHQPAGSTITKNFPSPVHDVMRFPADSSAPPVADSSVPIFTASSLSSLSSLPAPASSFKPQSEEIHLFFRSQGVVGEESNQELLVYGVLARNNMGIESLSGSGKSALLYALVASLPTESYIILNQATKKSLFNDLKTASVDFWVVPELQKIFNQDIEEIIKNITEGVSATYTRTNSRRDGVDHFEIKKKSVLYSFAITNKHCKERDEEFYRRFIQLHTDISKKQTKEILAQYAQREFCSQAQEYNGVPFKNHLAGSLAVKDPVRNPYLQSILETMPDEITSHLRFRSAVKYLQSLIKGRTIYTQGTSSKKELFSSLEDNVQVLYLYHWPLFENIHGLSVIDRAVLDLASLAEADLQGIRQSFNEHYGENIEIESSIKKLLFKGFLSPAGTVLSSRWNIKVEPEKLFAAADHLMQKEFPKMRDEWYEKNQQQLERGVAL